MMLTNADKPSRGISRAAVRGAPWPGALLIMLLLGMTGAPSFAAHTYQRWAQELGIDENVSYDGTRVMEIKGQQIEMTERRAPGKMYTEMYVGNMTVGIIVRDDLNKSYTLMPSMGFYREVSTAEAMTQASNGMAFSSIEKVGSDTVNGHPATRYQVQFSDNEGEGAGFIWVTLTGVPIKMDMTYSNDEVQGQRMNIEFRELNLREQDPGYFEVPSNLKPMSFGAGMPGIGQLMGMGGNNATGSAAPPSGAQQEGDLVAARQRCLEQARSANRQGGAPQGGAFGMLSSAAKQLGSMAGGLGLGGGEDAAGAAYAPGASAGEIAAAAQRLGVTPEDIERCRQP